MESMITQTFATNSFPTAGITAITHSYIIFNFTF